MRTGLEHNCTSYLNDLSSSVHVASQWLDDPNHHELILLPTPPNLLHHPLRHACFLGLHPPRHPPRLASQPEQQFRSKYRFRRCDHLHLLLPPKHQFLLRRDPRRALATATYGRPEWDTEFRRLPSIGEGSSGSLLIWLDGVYLAEVFDVPDNPEHGVAAPATPDLVGEGSVGRAGTLLLVPGASARVRKVEDLVGREEEGGCHPGGGGHLERFSVVGEQPWGHRRRRGGNLLLVGWGRDMVGWL